ncbi:hypothetical protein FOZ63_028741 [Perkinsus olseni]|uniref:Uncharacterized protein n=2 Tax=Perkinsus olseni TaxID=32597 RepID=A0A7J6SWJ8_PEROL|nr:hypothetical protein FOZ63_028741 [Perkinsus olseni]
MTVDPVVAYELCEREVLEGVASPGRGRRLQQIWRSRTLPFTEITYFGKILLGLSGGHSLGGTFIDWDPSINYGKGGCYYRLPDPLRVFGGPTRTSSPYLDLEQGQIYADLFVAPGISTRGWPSEFLAAEQEFAEFNVTPPSPPDPLLLAQYEAWKSRYQNLNCRSTESMTFDKSLPNRHWSQGIRTASRSCSFPVCNVDHGIRDKNLCAEKSGCVGAECSYCKSDNLPTEPNGVCLDFKPLTEADCRSEQGGVWVEGLLFNISSGRAEQTPPGQGVCALPHRPLVFCVGPLQTIRRCSDYQPFTTCDHDEIAKLIKCRSAHRQCQDPVSCRLSGRCSSSRSLQLREGGSAGRCILPTMNFDLLRQGCHRGLDVCFVPLQESPWGMMVVDMAEASADFLTQDAEAGRIHSKLDRGNYDPVMFNYTLKEARRVDHQRCDKIGQVLGISTYWVGDSWTRQDSEDLAHILATLMQNTRASPADASWSRLVDGIHGSFQACEALQGCCAASRRGDASSCDLFTGTIVDASNTTTLESERERCHEAGGEWRPVWSWIDKGEWVTSGELRETGLAFRAKEFSPINRWVDNREIDKSALRRILYSAFARLTSDAWVGYLRCRLHPTVKAMMMVAKFCSPQAPLLEPHLRDEQARYEERLGASYDPVHPSLHTLSSSFPLRGLHTTWLSAERIMQHGYADRLTTGDGVIVTWYRSLGTNKLQVEVVPREEAIALAANPLALPGRYAFAMAKLSRISPTATPTSPQPTRLPGFDKVGYDSYPEAFVQYMIRMANPELFDTTTPSPPSRVCNFPTCTPSSSHDLLQGGQAA